MADRMVPLHQLERGVLAREVLDLEADDPPPPLFLRPSVDRALSCFPDKEGYLVVAMQPRGNLTVLRRDTLVEIVDVPVPADRHIIRLLELGAHITIGYGGINGLYLTRGAMPDAFTLVCTVEGNMTSPGGFVRRTAAGFEHQWELADRPLHEVLERAVEIFRNSY